MMCTSSWARDARQVPRLYTHYNSAACGTFWCFARRPDFTLGLVLRSWDLRQKQNGTVVCEMELCSLLQRSQAEEMRAGRNLGTSFASLHLGSLFYCFGKGASSRQALSQEISFPRILFHIFVAAMVLKGQLGTKAF